MVVLVVSAIACANTGYCKFFYDGRFAGRKKRERGCHMDRKWLLEGNNSTQYNDNRQLLFSVTTLLPILV